VADAIVPMYQGPLTIDDATLERLTPMVIAARGTSGSCIKYVRGIAQELERLGIADSAVTDLWKAVQDRCKAGGIDPLTA
jgi:cation transport regulator ChaC